ncbi:unnamed protein product [Hermetia illucens]|uniref:Uncharacterized protein n=1 Tax=Hermetia illucens TaxID=343691 RepID=A0A7R8UN40_HERIL|nr:unnamed protein product [Hermetia illucens]
MRFLRTFWILCAVQIANVLSDAATDYNKVNNDGSFSFGLSNKDIGGHYHEATGSADKIVRGRYGARSPASGRIEETVYTAGPRGFRARGPRIHRKMDLSQYPRGPIGTPGDPYGDPNEDPSYAFNFRTSEYERREDADSTGRVRGLYSYLDDIGERHTVRYAAGAGTGFEVLNAVPDSPANVAYGAPLYKAPKGTRGRMATVRGPDGQYRFILSAPDHRRSESSGPDGVVRGSYSFLDDKGTQRTVQYIAGAGIGYRVVQSTTGAGSHLAPRPAIPQLESGRFRPTDRDRDPNDDRLNQYDDIGTEDRYDDWYNDRDGGFSGDRQGSRDKNDGGFSANGQDADKRRPFGEGADGNKRRPFGDRDDGNKRRPFGDRGEGDKRRPFGDRGEGDKRRPFGDRGEGDKRRPFGDRDDSGDRRNPFFDNRTAGYDYSQGSLGTNTRYGGKGGSNVDRGSTFGIKVSTDRYDDRYDDDYSFNKKFGSGAQKGSKNDYPSRDEYSPDRNRIPSDTGLGQDRPEFYDDDDQGFPVISTDQRPLNKDRNRDFAQYGRDSTILKNVGKWYVGLPPGASVRAHVQNIDLLPLGGRQPSPSEALRRDELASA